MDKFTISGVNEDDDVYILPATTVAEFAQSLLSINPRRFINDKDANTIYLLVAIILSEDYSWNKYNQGFIFTEDDKANAESQLELLLEHHGILSRCGDGVLERRKVK